MSQVELIRQAVHNQETINLDSIKTGGNGEPGIVK